MAIRAGTVRGRLFKTPLAAHHRLEYVRELLQWAYSAGRTPKDLQREFWEWYCGVYEDQMMQAQPHPWKRLMRDTADWDWPALRSRVRETIEAVLRPAGKPLKLRPIAVERGLGIWEARDGKRYFHYSARPDVRLDQSAYADAAVDMMLSDLHGINTDVMHLCEVCGRLFVSVRPTRGRYCSVACRNLGYLKSHGFKPPKKTAREATRKGTGQ